MKRKRKQEAAERNHIEGKFGQGKNGYNLNEIRARLKNTSESWIACIFFIMNLLHYEKAFGFCSIFKDINKAVIKIIMFLRQLKTEFELKLITDKQMTKYIIC